MKMYLGLICAVVLLLAPTLGWADSTWTVPVSAEVSEQLELDIWIKQVQDDQDPGTEGTIVTVMNFGSLTDTFADGTPAGALFARRWFGVFLIPNTSGRPYIVQQSSDGLSSGANTIPENTFVMIPDYEELDEWVWPDGTRHPQGPIPGGATEGNPGSAVGTDLPIYTSEPAGSSRIIRAYYLITHGYRPDGSEVPGFTGDPIPLDQPAGTYTGTVTFSVVLQ